MDIISNHKDARDSPQSLIRAPNNITMKQENDKSSPRDYSHPPTTKHEPSKTLKCPTCHRIKAPLSPLGILGPSSQTDASCNKCAPFAQLRSDMEVANAAFELLKERRRDHVRRKEALSEKVRRQAAFVNFVDEGLVVVDVDEEEEGGEERSAKAEELLKNEEPLSDGLAAVGIESQPQKRPLSPSPSRSPSTRPTKRPCLHPTPPTKRDTFASTVIFRDENEYRSSGLYLRGEKDYVSGRYAPGSGSVWLDTSGYEQDFSRFYRVKWVGRRWVEVIDGEDDDGGVGVDKQSVEEGEKMEAGGGGKRGQMTDSEMGDGERGRSTGGCVDAKIDDQNPEDETSEEGCGV